MEEKTVVIVGATGSIGRQTLDVLKSLKGYKLVGFTYHSNEEYAKRIAQDFKVDRYTCTKQSLSYGINLVKELKPDITVVAIPGFAGFELTFSVIPYTKRIALANKESLVCGGKFIIKRAQEFHTQIVPIDSEHSAIFQLIESSVERIAITASGGALRDWPLEKLKDARPEDVLKHPVWSMGKKVTIDSATMVNKAFEVLEAMELFSLKREQIDVFIHREGKIHGIVYLKDGTVKIHASLPDMRIPIALSLSYPKRSYRYEKFPDLRKITLEDLPKDRYPLFFLVDEVYSSYSLRTAYNAADEVAVDAFLNGKIGFMDMQIVFEKVLEKIGDIRVSNPEDLKEIDKEARKAAEEVVRWLSK